MPCGNGNASFTGANIAWCIAGAVYWTLAILGTFYAD